MGLNRLAGMILPGKAERPKPVAVLPVKGSKIKAGTAFWFARNCRLKSPVRTAKLGTE